MKSKSLALISLSACFVTPIFAQDFDSFIEITNGRPEYSAPYAILGIQPNMSPEEAKEILDTHLGRETSFEEGTLQISAPNGNDAEFKLRMQLGTFWITPFTRLGSEPYEQVYATLGTGVIDENIVGISRSIRDTPENIPAPNAIIAQLEAEYGPASYVDIGRHNTTIIYAWDQDGFIENLEAKSDALYKTSTIYDKIAPSGFDSLHPETPCKIDASVGYKFEDPRPPFENQNCKVLYRVNISRDGVGFLLIDYDLDQFNTIETDKQINDVLNEAPAESELKL